MAPEAFLKVFRSLGRWRRDAEFSTWMFSVALNHYRTTMRRHVPLQVDLAELDAVTGAGDLAGEMDAAANDRVVRRAVALLPPKYRDAILVYYFQQQGGVETAGTLGLRPGTVKAPVRWRGSPRDGSHPDERPSSRYLRGCSRR